MTSILSRPQCVKTKNKHMPKCNYWWEIYKWMYNCTLYDATLCNLGNSVEVVRHAHTLIHCCSIYWYCSQCLYSISGRTSYLKISWSLEAARFGFRLFQLLWTLRLQDYTTIFGGKALYHLGSNVTKQKQSLLKHGIKSDPVIIKQDQIDTWSNGHLVQYLTYDPVDYQTIINILTIRWCYISGVTVRYQLR